MPKDEAAVTSLVHSMLIKSTLYECHNDRLCLRFSSLNNPYEQEGRQGEV